MKLSITKGLALVRITEISEKEEEELKEFLRLQIISGVNGKPTSLSSISRGGYSFEGTFTEENAEKIREWFKEKNQTE